MGENFFFVFTAIPVAAAAGAVMPWATALGAVFVSGVLFLVLSLAGAREAVMNAISPSMKHAIAAGTGLFIAFIGLQDAGLIVKDPGTAVRLNANFASPDLVVFFVGLLVSAGLHARRVRGSIMFGILVAGVLAIALKWCLPLLGPDLTARPIIAESALVQRFQVAEQLLASPPSLTPTLLQMDVRGALSLAMLPVVAIFLFMVFLMPFDSAPASASSPSPVPALTRSDG